MVGILFGYAALPFDPQQAQGLAGAMRMMLHRPFGQFLLTTGGARIHRLRPVRVSPPDVAPAGTGRVDRRAGSAGAGSPILLALFTMAGSGAGELDEGLTTVLTGLRSHRLSDTSPNGYGLSDGRAHQWGSGSLDRGIVGVLDTQPAWGRCRRSIGRDTARTFSPPSRFPWSVTPAGPRYDCAALRTRFSPNPLLTTPHRRVPPVDVRPQRRGWPAGTRSRPSRPRCP